MSDQGRLGELYRQKADLQRQLDELYREYERDGSPGADQAPAGIDVIGMQLDRIEREIASLER